MCNHKMFINTQTYYINCIGCVRAHYTTLAWCSSREVWQPITTMHGMNVPLMHAFLSELSMGDRRRWSFIGGMGCRSVNRTRRVLECWGKRREHWQSYCSRQWTVRLLFNQWTIIQFGKRGRRGFVKLGFGFFFLILIYL